MITTISDDAAASASASASASQPSFQLEHENELVEHFAANSGSSNDSGNLSYYNKDIALKTVLFTMLFYICNSGLIRTILSKMQWIVLLGVELIQALIFAALFYIISFNI